MQLKNWISFLCVWSNGNRKYHPFKIANFDAFIWPGEILSVEDRIWMHFFFPYLIGSDLVRFISSSSINWHQRNVSFMFLFFFYETGVWVVRKIVCSTFFVFFTKFCLKSHLVLKLKLSRQIFFLWWQIFQDILIFMKFI